MVQKSTGGAYDRDWRAVEYVLAIEFIDFKGLLQNKKSQLKWTVANQLGIDHYLVERSMDRNNYNAVATVSANTSSDRMNYQTYDDVSSINATVFYYRITAVFKDGKKKA